MRNLALVTMVLLGACGVDAAPVDRGDAVIDPQTSPENVPLCPAGFDTHPEMTHCVVFEPINDPDDDAVCDFLPPPDGSNGNDPACSVACDREALRAYAKDDQVTSYECSSLGGPRDPQRESLLFFVVARP